MSKIAIHSCHKRQTRIKTGDCGVDGAEFIRLGFDPHLSKAPLENVGTMLFEAQNRLHSLGPIWAEARMEGLAGHRLNGSSLLGSQRGGLKKLGPMVKELWHADQLYKATTGRLVSPELV